MSTRPEPERPSAVKIATLERVLYTRGSVNYMWVECVVCAWSVCCMRVYGVLYGWRALCARGMRVVCAWNVCSMPVECVLYARGTRIVCAWQCNCMRVYGVLHARVRCCTWLEGVVCTWNACCMRMECAWNVCCMRVECVLHARKACGRVSVLCDPRSKVETTMYLVLNTDCESAEPKC